MALFAHVSLCIHWLLGTKEGLGRAWLVSCILANILTEMGNPLATFLL